MTNNKILIIVEGIADVIFLRDYLQFIYKDNEKFEKIPLKISSPIKGDDKVFELQVYKNPNIKLFCTGGITKLDKVASYINENFVALDYKLLLIFDTDSLETEKNNGGFAKRIVYIKTQIQKIETDKKIKLDFEDIFLLPTNLSTTAVEDAQDGDIETLLKDITDEEKFEKFIACYDTFCNCVSFSDFITEFTETKTKIYHYIQAFQGKDKAKERDRIYTSELWDFEHESLDNLKAFFEKNIG